MVGALDTHGLTGAAPYPLAEAACEAGCWRQLRLPAASWGGVRWCVVHCVLVLQSAQKFLMGVLYLLIAGGETSFPNSEWLRWVGQGSTWQRGSERLFKWLVHRFGGLVLWAYLHAPFGQGAPTLLHPLVLQP